ncbi:MAG: hypothetical protein ACOC0Z_04415 [Halohasta sp.]
MNRRTLLSGAATAALYGLAGCVDGTPEESNSTADEPAADEPTTPDGEFWQSVDDLPTVQEPTVVEFETASLTAAVVGPEQGTDDGFSVRMDFRSGASADAPATLVATVANTKPFEQPLELRRLGVLDEPSIARTSERDTLFVVPTEDHPLAERTPEYERDDDGRWRVSDLQDDWYPGTITVDGETGFVAEYYLLGTHLLDEPPIGPGRYRFGRDDSLAIVAWSTDEPGPDETSELADRDPPGLPGERETLWYHEATPETETFLRPDAETVRPPEYISFDLVNHSRRSIQGNPFDWRLYKLVAGEWIPVAPWETPIPAAVVGPGDRSESELAVFHQAPTASDRDRRADEVRTVGYLGGGLYAYTVGFETDDHQYAALIEVDAPDLHVDIGSDAEIVEEGSTTVVELPNHAEASRPATFTVTAGSDDDPDREIIPEQLPRRPFRGLRNALPLFEDGVESVQVKTDRGTALQLPDYEEDETVVVRYDETTYSAVGTLDE